MNQHFSIFCGIDVSKEWVDISLNQTTVRLDQTQQAIETFIQEHLSCPKDTLVVLESTGGHEYLAAQCFHRAGATVHIAHPNKVRYFARAKGQLAKTDPLDARLLAEYGQFIQPSEIRPLPSKRCLKLQALHSRLAQLKKLHHQEACRMEAAHDLAVKKLHESMLRVIEKQSALLEKKMLSLIKEDNVLWKKYQRLQTMIGVGPVIALSLVVYLPELGQVNKKEIAALIGVAPITKDSGKHIGRGSIQHGRANLRRMLFMAALVAVARNPKMEVFYKRLLANQKPKKVGLVAVMRKMLVIMNAMIMHETDYQRETA